MTLISTHQGISIQVAHFILYESHNGLAHLTEKAKTMSGN